MPSVSRLSFTVFVAALFLGTLASGVVYPLLPLQVDALLREDATLAEFSRWVGLAVALGPLTAAVTLPIWREVARGGRGREALLGIWAISGMVLATMSQARTVDQLLVLRLGLGCLGSVPILALAMAPLLGSDQGKGRRSVTILVATIAAFVLGAPLGGFMDRAIGMRLTFVFASLLSGTASLVLALGYHQPIAALAEPALLPPPPPRQWPWTGALFFAGAVIGAVVPLLPLYVTNALEVTTEMIGIWSGLAVGAVCLSGLIGGLSAILIADVLPLRAGAVICCLVAAVFAWLMAKAGHVVDLIAWAIAWAYPVGVMIASLQLLPARILPDNVRPSLASVGWVALPLGAAAGTLAGAYAGADRPQVIFAVSMIALACVMLLTPWARFDPEADSPAQPQP